EKRERLIGSGIGGGTLIGLAELLTGTSDFAEIVRLGANGNRANVDLQVKDIYGEGDSPLVGELTASNFGKVSQITNYTKEDQMTALIGMVAETAMLLSVQAANICKRSSVVYIGSTFQQNDLLQEVIKKHMDMAEMKSYFPKNGEMSGALGALFSLS